MEKAKQLCDQIWIDGEWVPWPEANIHLVSHVIHYGSSVFEGIRCYDQNGKSAIFRLREHLQRLLDSARIYRLVVPYGVDALQAACVEAVKLNRFRSCYLRPLVFRGLGGVGVNPFPTKVMTAILAWEWGAYLGPEALEKGVDVQVSSWTRLAPNTLPALAKCGANYMNSQLIKMEAITNGYAEGLALDATGALSEGSGENLFLIRQGKIFTPDLSSSILEGITRNSVMQVAWELGFPVVETRLPREMLYVADEIFMTGTAAEITPIRSVDKITVGTGARGPVTKKIQDRFLDILHGRIRDPYEWFTYVH